MGESKSNDAGSIRHRRRWSFADCVFDEANWSLTVDGRRVPIETKPLELLKALLIRAGSLVSKDELLDLIWPNVTVVEASLPTAVRKLRLALDDDRRETHIIETVPKIGYRLAVPVDVQELPEPPNASVAPAGQRPSAAKPPSRAAPLGVAAILLSLVVAGALLWRPASQPAPEKPRVAYPAYEAVSALHRLDIKKIDAMIEAGWNPDAPLDPDRNNALNRLLEMCEWNPGHDRAKMLYVARALIDGGITLDRHNKWGDTPYSIAKAKRYCGPDHPVTVMIHNMCYAKSKEAGDRCLATYEVKPKR